MPNPPCPHCTEELPSDLKGGGECPNCGEPFEVRKSQTLFPSPVVTQRQARILDSFTALQEFGVTESDYQAESARQEQEYGAEPDPGDVVWALWEGVSTQTIDHPERAGAIYRGMADFVKGEDRDARDLYQKSARAELLAMKNDASRAGLLVQVLTAGDERTCAACNAAGERGAITVDEALQNPSVPNPECASDKCRCTYSYSRDPAADPALEAQPAETAPEATPTDKSGCLPVLATVAIAAVLLVFV